MTVAKEYRGLGIGRKMLQYAIEWARRNRIARLYLETNSKLRDAIHLYEACGFTHMAKERKTSSPYARANVFMELWLSDSTRSG
jgi:GNAT superfamily N-acetyltransferase